MNRLRQYETNMIRWKFLDQLATIESDMVSADVGKSQNVQTSSICNVNKIRSENASAPRCVGIYVLGPRVLTHRHFPGHDSLGAEYLNYSLQPRQEVAVNLSAAVYYVCLFDPIFCLHRTECVSFIFECAPVLRVCVVRAGLARIVMVSAPSMNPHCWRRLHLFSLVVVVCSILYYLNFI